MKARRRHALPAELPLAEHQIGVGPRRGVEQPRRFAGQMLHVAVEQQHVRERTGHHLGQTGADRASLPLVGAQREHLGAGRTRRRSGPVGRPVVHHQHMGDDAAQSIHHLGDRPHLIERRDQRHRIHVRWPISSAGSTRIDAAVSVNTLTIETIAIDRRGG